MKTMFKTSMAIACLALVALFAGCPLFGSNDEEEGPNLTPGPGPAHIPAELVGSWGAGNVEFIRINADGTGTLDGNAATWAVNGNRLNLTLDLGAAHGGVASGSALWQIVEGRLRLMNGQGITGPLLEALPDLERLGGGNEGGPGQGQIPAALVGEWGVGGTAFLTINADGTGALQGNPVEWSVDGNRLTMTIDLGAGHGGAMSSSAAWEIVDGRLRLTDGQGHMGPILTTAPYLDRLGGDDPGDDNGPGYIPTALVGEWGVGDTAFLTINADGTGELQGTPVEWSVDGNRLTMTIDLGAGHGGPMSSSVAWEIVDGRLRLTDGQGHMGPILTTAPYLDRLGGDDPGDDNGPGYIPATLVGEWGVGDTAFLTINADGTGELQGTPVEWSVDGNRLTMTIDLGAGHGGAMSSSAAWEIVGGRLRLTDGQGHMGPILTTAPYLDRLGGGQDGDIPATLVGSWGIGSDEMLLINADGTGTIHGNAAEWSVEGNRLTVTFGGASGSADWQIVGGRLVLSNGQGVHGTLLQTLPDFDRLGVIPSEIVGVWGNRNTGAETLRINADGTGTIHGNVATWSMDGNRLSVSFGGASGSAAWQIVGGRLRLSNGQGAHGTLLQLLPDLDRLDGDGAGTFTISFAEFYRMTPITVLEPIRITGSPAETLRNITVDNPGQYQFGSIRWMIGGTRITAGVSGVFGETLTLDSGIHGNLEGSHTVTVVVTDMNGVTWSQRITFTVVP